MNYNYNTNPSFQPGGVSHNPYGQSYPVANAPSAFAGLATMSAFSKAFSKSSSYPSTSSKVSIVRYDDHFKDKKWCLKNLVKNDGSEFTEQELKENPPLALKFDDCPVIVPIPSYAAMHATSKQLIRTMMTPGKYAAANDDAKAQMGKSLSEALIKQYVEDCNYGTDPLSESCAPTRLPHEIPPETRPELEAARNARAHGTPRTVRQILDIEG
ncbi:unnamed protein product [Pylaiella littoralis]